MEYVGDEVCKGRRRGEGLGGTGVERLDVPRAELRDLFVAEVWVVLL